jgi:hypothetical protein
VLPELMQTGPKKKKKKKVDISISIIKMCFTLVFFLHEFFSVSGDVLYLKPKQRAHFTNIVQT